MVTISPNCVASLAPEPDLEQAGRLPDGTPVLCSVVMSDNPNGEMMAIVEGYGGRLRSYHALQKEGAILGIGSVNVEPIYRTSRHQNRLQAIAVEKAIEYVGDRYGVQVTSAYGHSWGASKLASLLHHGVPGIRTAIFHNPAGFESAFKNMAARPWGTIQACGRELVKIAHMVGRRGHAEDFDTFPDWSELPAYLQQGLVASEHHNVARHLSDVREKQQDVKLIGLWAEQDMFFKLHGHPVFHHNETMPGSIHVEPQTSPERVAKKLAELLIAA